MQSPFRHQSHHGLSISSHRGIELTASLHPLRLPPFTTLSLFPQLRPHLGAPTLRPTSGGPSYCRPIMLPKPAHHGTSSSPPMEQRDLPLGDPGGTEPDPLVFWSMAGVAVCISPREPGGVNTEETAAAPREPGDGKAEETSAVPTATAIAATAAACSCDTVTAAPNSVPRATAIHGGQAGGSDATERRETSSSPICRWIWCCCRTAL